MNQREIEDIEALVEAATPGPWSSGSDGTDTAVFSSEDIMIAQGFDRPEDARLVARARAELPRLIREVVRLQAQLHAERDYRERLERWISVAREKLDSDEADRTVARINHLEDTLRELVIFLNDETSYPSDRPHPLAAAERLLDSRRIRD